MSFNNALSGLRAANTDLGVISNNVANANTVGFKESRAEFADVYGQSLFSAPNQASGSGVQVAAITQQFQQGNLNSTDNPLDLAINGNGFFVLSNNGETTYTRNGAFQVDANGYLVSAQGARLQGINGDLQVPTEAVAPTVTTSGSVSVNLDATAEAIDPAAIPFDPNNADSYHFTTTLTVYDSLGSAHQLSAFFTRTDATTNDWQVHFTLDGGVPLDTGTTPPTPTVYGPETLSFDTSGQVVDGGGQFTLAGLATGNAANDLEINLDFSGSTQYGSAFATNALSQNGNASGKLVGVAVDSSGNLLGRYDNGQTQTLGQVALANFANPQGLVPIGENQWAISAAAGEPLIGPPGSGQLGDLRSGALEQSNVDLTQELVNMITAQRNFQANAQMINTMDSVTQTLLNR